MVAFIMLVKGSEAPYGYTYIPRTDNCSGRLVINEIEVEVVRSHSNYLYLCVLSPHKITNYFN